MPFRKQNPVCRIERGYDELGRTMMRIQKDQQFVYEKTGAYDPDPVMKPLGTMLDINTPISPVLSEEGWFRPSEAFEQDLTNYQLGNMYEPDTINPKGYEGTVMTPDKGRLSVTVAELDIKKDGSYALKAPVKTLDILPGKDLLYITDIQDAATEVAQNENWTKEFYEVRYLAQERSRIREHDIKEAGGRKAVLRECDLRNVLHNQKIYEDYDTKEAIRFEGNRVLDEINEMHDAAMAGKSFADAVQKLSEEQKNQAVL